MSLSIDSLSPRHCKSVRISPITIGSTGTSIDRLQQHVFSSLIVGPFDETDMSGSTTVTGVVTLIGSHAFLTVEPFEFTPTVDVENAVPLDFATSLPVNFRPAISSDGFVSSLILTRPINLESRQLCETLVSQAGNIMIIPRSPDTVGGFYTSYGSTTVHGFTIGWPMP